MESCKGCIHEHNQTQDCMHCSRAYTDEYEGKPPLGIAPYYIIAQSRISSLAQAIDRYALEAKAETGVIKKWAKEIVAQCDLVEIKLAFN